jgi:hypothetical protein
MIGWLDNFNNWTFTTTDLRSNIIESAQKKQGTDALFF